MDMFQVGLSERTLHLTCDGATVATPFTALRARCDCPACRHPSGQRLLDPVSIAYDVRPAVLEQFGDVLEVRWNDDGHRSAYRIEQLLGTDAGAGPAARGWDSSFADVVPVIEHDALVRRDGALLAWLEGVAAHGIGVVRAVPQVDGEVARVAERFAHVRQTNYGRWFDVRSVVDPTNLANTTLGLAAHTDNPYRDPVPTLQLLHCLSSTAQGGENFVVDGWRIADELRTTMLGGFEQLARRAVTFSYDDSATSLSATAPLIELDGRARVIGVRFNPRSMEPPVARVGDRADEQSLAAWYDAYLRFARLAADERLQLRFKLRPGDLFIVDNRRVLHGRTAFTVGEEHGERHLQGCYADIDGLRSTLAVLRRERS